MAKAASKREGKQRVINALVKPITIRAYKKLITDKLDAIEALNADDNIKRMHLNELMENIGDELRNKRRILCDEHTIQDRMC